MSRVLFLYVSNAWVELSLTPRGRPASEILCWGGGDGKNKL